MVRGILKRDEKRRKRIKDAGIDYECPELVSEYLILLNLGVIWFLSLILDSSPEVKYKTLCASQHLIVNACV